MRERTVHRYGFSPAVRHLNLAALAIAGPRDERAVHRLNRRLGNLAALAIAGPRNERAVHRLNGRLGNLAALAMAGPRNERAVHRLSVPTIVGQYFFRILRIDTAGMRENAVHHLRARLREMNLRLRLLFRLRLRFDLVMREEHAVHHLRQMRILGYGFMRKEDAVLHCRQFRLLVGFMRHEHAVFGNRRGFWLFRIMGNENAVFRNGYAGPVLAAGRKRHVVLSLKSSFGFIVGGNFIPGHIIGLLRLVDLRRLLYRIIIAYTIHTCISLPIECLALNVEMQLKYLTYVCQTSWHCEPKFPCIAHRLQPRG